MPPAIPKLLIQEYSTPQKPGHFARTIMTCEPRPFIHAQNFFEIFWIEQGEGWHFINDRKIELLPGCVCFVRDQDRHGFSSKPTSRMIMANIAFPPDILRDLAIRHLEFKKFFSPRPLLPQTVSLDGSKLRELTRDSRFLGEGPLPRLRIEWLLLGIMTMIHPEYPHAEYNDLPEWLRFACQKIQSGTEFQGGTTTLARLAGRTPEHVARTLRKLRGITPTDVVNQARMRYAADALATTEEKIAHIALETGFQNLGAFYQIFRRTHGVSPRQYRLQQRSIFQGKSV